MSENVSVADAPRKVATKSMPQKQIIASVPLKNEQPKILHEAFKEEKHTPIMFSINPNNSFKVMEKIQDRNEKTDKHEKVEKYERFDRFEKKTSISDKLKGNFINLCSTYRKPT